MKKDRLMILSLLFVMAISFQNGFAFENTKVSDTVVSRQINILFIGNSFTFRHNLPILVKTVFEEGNPGLKVNWQIAGYGGQNLFMHSNYYFSQSVIEQSTITADSINARISRMQNFLKLTINPPAYQTFFDTLGKLPWIFPKTTPSFGSNFDIINTAIVRHNNLLKSNPKTKWDYVVLQSWQDVYPSYDQGYALGIRSLLKSINAQGAKIILYITAPYIQNNAPVTGPNLQDRVNNDINVAKWLADSVNAYAVVPVPLALNMIQKNGTNYKFCYVNDFHPNQRTAFLTSNMFYAAFFKKSTEGFNYNTVTETKQTNGLDPDGGPATVTFEGEEKLYLQRMAYASVMKFDSLSSSLTTIDPISFYGSRSLVVIDLGNNVFSLNANIGTNFEIIDLTGKRVQTGVISSENMHLNLSTFNKGIYVLKLALSDNIFTRKLIVQ